MSSSRDYHIRSEMHEPEREAIRRAATIGTPMVTCFSSEVWHVWTDQIASYAGPDLQTLFGNNQTRCALSVDLCKPMSWLPQWIFTLSRFQPRTVSFLL